MKNIVIFNPDTVFGFNYSVYPQNETEKSAEQCLRIQVEKNRIVRDELKDHSAFAIYPVSIEDFLSHLSTKVDLFEAYNEMIKDRE